MSKREYIFRYLLIIQKLRDSKVASFEEINDYLTQTSSFEENQLAISKRTFQRDLNEISSIFNVVIKCNRDNKYYIEEEFNDDANLRMLESFNVFNLLKYAGDNSKFILLEKRRSQGTEHFYGLLHAIQNYFIIHFNYQKFWENEITQRSVDPYALKEFKGRWYIVANDRKDNIIKTFGLDRISNFEITQKHFKHEISFNANDYFKNCFGILTDPDNEPEEVILSFEPVQGKYIKSFPLHESQTILTDNINELRIKLKIYLTHDFLMELLSHGATLEIIAPKKLKDNIQNLASLK